MTVVRRLFGTLLLTGTLSASSLFALSPYGRVAAELPALAAAVETALARPIQTVVEKPAGSPSADPHDYVSYARYYWPNPDTPDGLPYVSRDGYHNHPQVARGDHARLWEFCATVEQLAAAWSVDHNEAAAQRAVAWMRAWFITPATKMNPNLEYAQVRLGRNHNLGSEFGVLDARCFAQVIDALRLLHGSPALSATDEAGIRAWFTTYLHWLETAPNAIAERANLNNHGTWYLAQVIPIALYLGRDDLARELSEEEKTRIAREIEPDGSQPNEIRRVDGLGYSKFNLEAHASVARQAANVGLNLWNFTAENGASLHRALEFLQPYNVAPKSWPQGQHEDLQPGFLDPLLAEPGIVAAKLAANATPGTSGG